MRWVEAYQVDGLASWDRGGWSTAAARSKRSKTEAASTNESRSPTPADEILSTTPSHHPVAGGASLSHVDCLFLALLRKLNPKRDFFEVFGAGPGVPARGISLWDWPISVSAGVHTEQGVRLRNA